MNKISLAFALVFFIALSFTGCKSTKKVGTVEAGGAKAHNEFFALMQEQGEERRVGANMPDGATPSGILTYAFSTARAAS